MPDRSYLSWPFFDDSHRKLAGDLKAWAEQNILETPGSDVDRQCRSLASALASGGWLRHIVPAEISGKQSACPPALDVRSICLIREILAYHSALADFAFAMQGLGATPVGLFGSDALKRRYLPKLESAAMVGAFAISEPEAGSDVRALQTTARRDGDSYIVNGCKTWISNAGLADFYIVFCRFPEMGEKAYVALAIEKTTPGFTIERFEIIAPHPIGTLRFNNCSVPASALVGTEGEGLKIALATLDLFRSTVGGAAVGFARRALDEAISYSRKRKQFGQALSEFQITQAKLAEMALAIDASALLVYRAAWTHDVLKQSVTREVAMAKLHATESAQKVIDEALQLFGGRGVLAGSITERLYREIRALRIYEGTSEIQKLIIAGQVLKEKSAKPA
ncbi:MAG TPA: acyl-CoA dehydrogenase family protein [Terriglobales bacterium]|nr:acyl-CoA dehydrogenase family protein [Terriglobales bacterium]